VAEGLSRSKTGLGNTVTIVLLIVLLCVALVVLVGAVYLASRLATADIVIILRDFWLRLFLFGATLSGAVAVLLLAVGLVGDRVFNLLAKLGQKKPFEQRRWAGGVFSASASFVVSATGFAVSAQFSSDPLTKFIVFLSLFLASAGLTVCDSVKGGGRGWFALTILALAALGAISLLVLFIFASTAISDLLAFRITENLFEPLTLLILFVFMLGLHAFLIWDRHKQR